MGFFSKVWKGVKKAVKRVARAAKKVAKKVTYAMPGGKALWKAGTKVGQGVMKAVGKITSALGPVGMFALSFVLPGLGTILGSLFSAIPGAGALSSFASGMIEKLGMKGLNVFSGDSFLSKTIGKLGDAITKGVDLVKSVVPQGAKDFAGKLVDGFKKNFPKASEQLTKLTDQVFDTGPTFTEKVAQEAAAEAATLAPGASAEMLQLSAKNLASERLLNPTISDGIQLFGENTGITKTVKVAQNAKNLADQIAPKGPGAADQSAAPQRVAAGAVVAPASTPVQAPAGIADTSLRAVGSSGKDFFQQLVEQAQQTRGGFA